MLNAKNSKNAKHFKLGNREWCHTANTKLLTLLVFNSFPYSSAWQYQAQGLVNLAVNWEEKQPLGS